MGKRVEGRPRFGDRETGVCRGREREAPCRQQGSEPFDRRIVGDDEQIANVLRRFPDHFEICRYVGIVQTGVLMNLDGILITLREPSGVFTARFAADATIKSGR